MPSRATDARWLAIVRALLIVATVAAGEARAQESSLRASITNSLVVPTEERFEAFRWEREPRFLALYFGAEWCPPCHAFLPDLKRFHAALREAGADTEVVYVSLDSSQAEMRRYMRRHSMPWPAIDYRRLKTLSAIRALAGLAPPNLVLLDRDGSVLANGWRGRRYQGLQPVLTAWLAAVSQEPPQSSLQAKKPATPP